MPAVLENSTGLEVVLGKKLQGELCGRAFALFTSKPGEGTEAGGVLYGSHSEDAIHAEAFLELGEENLEDLVEAGPLPAIGLFRFHTRKETGLTEGEMAAFRAIDGLVFLTVKPISVSRAEGTAYVRVGGRLEERRILLRADDEARPGRPRPPGSEERSSWRIGIRKVWMATALISTIALGVGWMVFQPAPQPELRFDAVASGKEIQASWKVTAAGDRPLQEATLTVRELGKERVIDLTGDFQSEGMIRIRPRGSDISLTMRVRHQGAARLERSTTYVGFGPGGDRAEVNALRRRNRELEQMVRNWR